MVMGRILTGTVNKGGECVCVWGGGGWGVAGANLQLSLKCWTYFATSLWLTSLAPVWSMLNVMSSNDGKQNFSVSVFFTINDIKSKGNTTKINITPYGKYTVITY